MFNVFNVFLCIVFEGRSAIDRFSLGPSAEYSARRSVEWSVGHRSDVEYWEGPSQGYGKRTTAWNSSVRKTLAQVTEWRFVLIQIAQP